MICKNSREGKGRDILETSAVWRWSSDGGSIRIAENKRDWPAAISSRSTTVSLRALKSPVSTIRIIKTCTSQAKSLKASDNFWRKSRTAPSARVYQATYIRKINERIFLFEKSICSIRYDATSKNYSSFPRDISNKKRGEKKVMIG